MSRSSSHSHVTGSDRNNLSMESQAENNVTEQPSATQSFTENEKPTSSESNLLTPDGGEPTEEEITTLRHVSDRIPLACWLAAGISLTERFTYYGINSPFRKSKLVSEVSTSNGFV